MRRPTGTHGRPRPTRRRADATAPGRGGRRSWSRPPADEVEEVGYAGLTVRIVARRAGVAPATAYTYFSSKDHLLAEVLWRRMQALPPPGRRRADRSAERLADVGPGTSGCSPPRARPWSTPAPSALLSPTPRRQAPARPRSAPRSTAGCRPPSAPTSTRWWSGCSRRRLGRAARRRAWATCLRRASPSGPGRRGRADAGRAASDHDRGAGAAATGRYSPYDYEIHEDPYPVYARLRAEAPVYRNDELDFWALSRHEDVLAAFRNVDGFSNAYGVSLDPAAFGPDAHRAMSFLALDPPRHTRMRSLVGKGFTPRRGGRRWRTRIRAIAVEHLDAALERGHVRLHRRLRRQAAHGRDLRAGRRARGRPGRGPPAGRPGRPPRGRASSTSPRRAWTPPSPWSATTRSMVDERRPAPGDDLTSALLEAELDGDRLTDDEIDRLPLPHGGGRQRDDHQAARQRLVLGRGATPTSGPSPSPTRLGCPTGSRRPCASTPRARCSCGWPATRRRVHGTTHPRGRPGPAAGRLGQPRRGRSSPTPTATTSTGDTVASWSASAAGATSAWAPRWPGWRPGSASTSWWRGSATYDIDPDGIERVHSINVRGLAALPDHRSRPLVGRC